MYSFGGVWMGIAMSIIFLVVSLGILLGVGYLIVTIVRHLG